jgi:formylglycine-generating enzyme required for sulfatase activity
MIVSSAGPGRRARGWWFVLPAALCAALLMAAPAAAGQPSMKAARGEAKLAFAAHKEKRFGDAATHFLKAFELSGRKAAKMLHNAAKASELAGDVEQALQLWEDYVALDGLRSKDRKKALTRLRELHEQKRNEPHKRAPPESPIAFGGPPSLGAKRSTRLVMGGHEKRTSRHPSAASGKGARARSGPVTRADLFDRAKKALGSGELSKARELFSAAASLREDAHTSYYLGWIEAIEGRSAPACERWSRLEKSPPPVSIGGLALEPVLCEAEALDGKTARFLGSLVQAPASWRRRVHDVQAVVGRLRARKWLEIDAPLKRLARLKGRVGETAAELREAVLVHVIGFSPSEHKSGPASVALVRDAIRMAKARRMDEHDTLLRRLGAKGLSPGPGFFEVIAPHSVDWVAIPAGHFEMGSGDGPRDEQPLHKVQIPAFQLSRTEVTAMQYARCVMAGKCSEPAKGMYCTWGKKKLMRHPVNCVTYTQAEAFARWVGGRLPSEAEWEYAARNAGRMDRHPWGYQEADCQRAVIDQIGSSGCGRKGTEIVCSVLAGHTKQGLCDMIGNVAEWVHDTYHPSYEGAPQSARPWVQAGPKRRVARGCSWRSRRDRCRATSRDSAAAAHADGTLGFRVARSLR